ncbi:hypothetical protein KY285_008383 [Solanum tuberosum]|nr:hypothetical protein KY284_008376 [Solanum tuberosum]KAH0746726.1 hypothetical protein KY285_008383 [Solanum tuberosum]
MESAARRSGGGVLEGFYRLVMRRTPVYVTFVIAGALLGERAVDYGVKTLWEKNNVGRLKMSPVAAPSSAPGSYRVHFFSYENCFN